MTLCRLILHKSLHQRITVGIDLPVCGFCRSKYGTYPEYHTDADNFNVLTKKGLIGSFQTMKDIVPEIKKCGEEDVKVIIDNNKRIVSIGKELDIKESLGEFIGVAKLSIPFCDSFGISLSRLIDKRGKSDYFESAIEPILNKHDVYFEDISHLPCIEIDFKEDLQKANQLVKNILYNI